MKIAVSFELSLDFILRFSVIFDGQEYYLIVGEDQLTVKEALILLKGHHIRNNKFLSIKNEVLEEAFLYKYLFIFVYV